MKTLILLLLILFAVPVVANYPYIPGHFPEWKQERLPNWNGTFGRFEHWPVWAPGYGIEKAIVLPLNHPGQDILDLAFVTLSENLLSPV